MIKYILIITLGFFLVFVGLIGGLIPIFQGWIFGIPGLIILSKYFPPEKRLLYWAKKKVGIKKRRSLYRNYQQMTKPRKKIRGFVFLMLTSHRN
jgi:uncharacterized membrane protein YbaN (DUF454 family)